jgi:serine/threonine protein kinase
VKKLSKTDEFSEKQFEDEVTCLIRVKHKNIVRFLGYCSDTQKQVVSYNGKYVMAEVRQRLLCFEYAPNKTLYDYLKGMNMATTLFISLTYYLRPKNIILVLS